MINAASSIASSVLSSAFGSSAPSASATLPGSDTASASTTAYSIDASLLSAIQSPGAAPAGSILSQSFLSNAVFAQDTATLLSDPQANGKITGTPSANVQKLLSEIDPASQASTPTDNATTSTATPTPSLPADGILA